MFTKYKFILADVADDEAYLYYNITVTMVCYYPHSVNTTDNANPLMLSSVDISSVTGSSGNVLSSPSGIAWSFPADDHQPWVEVELVHATIIVGLIVGMSICEVVFLYTMDEHLHNDITFAYHSDAYGSYIMHAETNFWFYIRMPADTNSTCSIW